jgi:hypothetical protein
MDEQLAQLLLTQVAGGGQGGLSLPELLAQTMPDDPVAASLLSAIGQREAIDDAEEAGSTLDPDTEALLERLATELDALRETTRVLADALGACRRCFGEDELCPVCRGRGRPGGRQPDPVLFDELVAPALERHAALAGGNDEWLTRADLTRQ